MKFWTNRIKTGNSASFSDIVEKIAASRQQTKTASTVAVPQKKVAEKTEPANDENKMRKNVHGPEGSPSDGNGKPEEDGEKKTVESQSAPIAAKPAVKPAAPIAGKPVAKPSAPIASKPAAPVAGKPSVKPTAPVASKPAVPVAAKPSPALASDNKEVKVAEEGCCEEGEKNKGKFPEPDREQMYKQEPQEDGKAKTEKESSTSPKFEKIANLKPKAKTWLKKYWSMLYPSDYADAMTQDK
jgi:hypothetical protein